LAWGDKYLFSDIKEIIEDFILYYQKDGKAIYREQLLRNIENFETTFKIDFQDLLQYNYDIAEMVLSDQEVFETFKKTVYEMHCADWVEQNGKWLKAKLENKYYGKIHPTMFNFILENQYLNVKIREAKKKVKRIGAVVKVKGLVISKSDVRMQLVKGHFLHADPNCMGEFDFPDTPIEAIQLMPTSCKLCGKRGNIVLLEDKSEYIPWQKVIIEETTEELESSEAPQQIDVELVDGLVDTVHIGDKIEIVGVLSAKSKPTKTHNKLIIDRYIHANEIKVLETNALDIEISKEDIEKIKQLAKRDDIIDLIIRSIAPSIYGMEFAKEAVALSLFSGVTRVRFDEVIRRGNIHTLIIGDPGIAKSQLLQFVSKIMPRAVYVDCKNTTGVGLTASAVFDKEINEWRIDAGAMPLADQSVLLLDEVDKLSDDDRAHLNTPMEQQIVVVHKADRSARLFARCAVIAVANPKWKRFVNEKGIEENIPFPADFLSRFDIIIIMKDEPNEQRDREMAEYRWKIEHENSDRDFITPDLLGKYIIYAKKHIHPQLSEDAKKILEEFWVKARQKTKESLMQFTPRQLEGLERMAEAYAKMRLSNVVSKDDAVRAVMFMEKMLKTLNIDVETGLSQETFEKIRKVYDIIDSLSSTPIKNYSAELGDILLNAKEQYGLDADEVERIINRLRSEGKIREVEPRRYTTR